MSRIYVMTIGMFMILLGAQVFAIKSYVLTPSASQFVAERFQETDPVIASNDGSLSYSPFSRASSTFSQSGYQYASNSYATPTTKRSVTPPTWLCWPILFFGAVVFLHGVALKNQ